MVKKIIIRKRTRRDNFSLKKLGKGIVNVAKDSVKLAVAPVKLAVSSVTGKPVKTEYSTKVGKVVAKVHDTGSKALTSTVKGFADTVTGGYATKAANLLRKDEYKEKPFAYNEQKKSIANDISLGKTLDKVAVVLPTVGAVAGGTVAGVLAGNKALSLTKKQGSDNMKNSGLEIGPNVITGMPVLGSESPKLNEFPKSGGELIKGVPHASEFSPIQQTQQPGVPTMQASFGNFELNPMTIGIIVVAIILLVIAAKNK
jgi:hypothetical protein